MHDVDNHKTTTRAQYPRGLLDGMLPPLDGPDVVDRQAGGAAQPRIGQSQTGAVVAYGPRAAPGFCSGHGSATGQFRSGDAVIGRGAVTVLLPVRPRPDEAAGRC